MQLAIGFFLTSLGVTFTISTVNTPRNLNVNRLSLLDINLFILLFLVVQMETKKPRIAVLGFLLFSGLF